MCPRPSVVTVSFISFLIDSVTISGSVTVPGSVDDTEWVIEYRIPNTVFGIRYSVDGTWVGIAYGLTQNHNQDFSGAAPHSSGDPSALVRHVRIAHAPMACTKRRCTRGRRCPDACAYHLLGAPRRALSPRLLVARRERETASWRIDDDLETGRARPAAAPQADFEAHSASRLGADTLALTSAGPTVACMHRAVQLPSTSLPLRHYHHHHYASRLGVRPLTRACLPYRHSSSCPRGSPWASAWTKGFACRSTRPPPRRPPPTSSAS